MKILSERGQNFEDFPRQSQKLFSFSQTDYVTLRFNPERIRGCAAAYAITRSNWNLDCLTRRDLWPALEDGDSWFRAELEHLNQRRKLYRLKHP